MSADAAGAGRRHRDDLVSAVGALDRRPLLRRVVLQIVARDQSAVRQHLFFERERGFALVEAGRTLRRDALERAREIRLLQRVARLRTARRSSMNCATDAGYFCIVAACALLQRAGEPFGDREAVARERDGGIDQTFPRQLALFLPRQVQPGDRPWDADGEMAVVVHLRAVLAVLHEHRRRRFCRAPPRGSRRRRRRLLPGDRR